MPRNMPTNSGMNCVSLSSLTELPRAARGAIEVGVAADDLQHVAEPQPQVRRGGHLEVGPGDARDGHAGRDAQGQLAEALAEHGSRP